MYSIIVLFLTNFLLVTVMTVTSAASSPASSGNPVHLAPDRVLFHGAEIREMIIPGTPTMELGGDMQQWDVRKIQHQQRHRFIQSRKNTRLRALNFMGSESGDLVTVWDGNTTIIGPQPKKHAHHKKKKKRSHHHSSTDGQRSTPAHTVLILYDYRPAQLYGKLGQIYAIMLRNLLGHFQGLQVTMLPVDQYTGGQIDGFDVTFYLGSYYDNPIPSSFLQDVLTTERTLVWFKYNIWQLAWNDPTDFSSHFGFAFYGLRGLEEQPTISNPEPGFFDTVLYKGQAMTKYYSYDANTDTVYSDPDLGATQVVNPDLTQIFSEIRNSATGELLPYVIKGGNLWYFADIPFSYIDSRDRYLVLCDLLHDLLNRNHPEMHNALVRLEDLNAQVRPSTVKKLSRYLHKHHIPFALAVVPFYRDPLGINNDGYPEEIHLEDAHNLRKALRYALRKGGSLLMHGYTHQYESIPNPSTAVSTDDFEFWNIVENRPVDEDSRGWVLNRLDNGLDEFASVGYQPWCWETPHYQASPVAYRTFPERFAITYQRMVYYTSEYPVLTPGDPDADIMAGQFFPYPIYQDYYGQRIVPENLGNIEYDLSDIDPTSYYNYTPADILTNADYTLVVRDGMGAFFFHPFLLEKELHVPGFHDFQEVIKGLQHRGYHFIDAQDIFAGGNP